MTHNGTQSDHDRLGKLGKVTPAKIQHPFRVGLDQLDVLHEHQALQTVIMFAWASG